MCADTISVQLLPDNYSDSDFYSVQLWSELFLLKLWPDILFNCGWIIFCLIVSDFYFLQLCSDCSDSHSVLFLSDSYAVQWFSDSYSV